jgi:hypothetical protein
MGKREEAVTLLRSGLSPGAIRRIQGVSLQTIFGYLDELVGRGVIRRSDILFSVPAQIRHEVLRLISEDEKVGKDIRLLATELSAHGIEADDDDILVTWCYRDERFAFGDMYEDIRTIETTLHRSVREALEEEHGGGEEGWWRKGVPLPIRQECVTRREEDDDPANEPYAYTDLLHLCKIAEKQWKVVSPRLPEAVAANRKCFVEDLEHLNRIRRKVMHPVRGPAPSEDDFEFVRELRRKLKLL